MLRFSGHDTFHCKEQWLLKGIQLIEQQGDANALKKESAISKLGVGKNMVRSIQHWLKAFDLANEEDGSLKPLSHLIFISEELDPYLENENSLLILQYHLCAHKYASIFHLIFSEYFLKKASLEFTESQVIAFLERKIADENHRKTSPKTLSADFKVFVKTYLVADKNYRNIEDDFSAPLLGLNLLKETGKRNSQNERVFRINRNEQEGLSEEVFAYGILIHFPDEVSLGLDRIRNTVSAYFCLSNEGLELKISNLCNKYPDHFVYKEDAGIKQLQIKKNEEAIRMNFLKRSYDYVLHS